MRYTNLRLVRLDSVKKLVLSKFSRAICDNLQLINSKVISRTQLAGHCNERKDLDKKRV